MPTPILDLFTEKDLVKICAPMVRYSKLQFRTLVRNYGCDLCYTPMIIADSFCKSEKARLNEFTTNKYDSPLVVQFAAKTVHDFVGATYLVTPYCDGVEVNCGCPQRWAMAEGYGSALLTQPELLSDLIHQCRAYVSDDFTISAKIRLLTDIKKSVDLCQKLERAGVSYITVHGRTPAQRTEPINTQAITTIKQSVHVPLIANGDVKTLDDAKSLQEITGCNGVMVARGILTNPALFAGYSETPMECVQKWLNICYNNIVDYQTVLSSNEPPGKFPERHPNLTFQCFHHHLVFMFEKILPKRQRKVFNNLQTFFEVLDFLEDNFQIVPELFTEMEHSKNAVLNLSYENRDEIYLRLLKNSETNKADKR